MRQRVLGGAAERWLACAAPELPDRRPPACINALSLVKASEPGVWSESVRVFHPSPLVTPKGARSSLQMLAIARAMAVLCA